MPNIILRVVFASAIFFMGELVLADDEIISGCENGHYVEFNKIHFDVKAITDEKFYIIDKSTMSENEKKRNYLCFRIL